MRKLARHLTHALNRWNLFAIAVAVSIGMGISCSAILAQSGAGSIQGTVTDPTGAVIPGATIQVVNKGTNVSAETKSNGVGFYQVPSLFTGHYSVTISSAGMKTYKTSIELLVDQRAVINPVMTAGSITQQVEVAADVVQLTTTENGTIASTLENSRINQLPMNGRILLNLAGQTTPGLEGSGTRANGLMGEALEYVADGAPLVNRNFGGASQGSSTQAQLPDPDSVQEVRVETTNTSAQFSEPATAIITTKSGANALHGSLFETARNNAIGIAKNRNNPANYSAPHLVRNEFGASAGGPIIVPKLYHGKDKSFWFFAFERYSLAQIVNELATAPTSAMRSGDWSGLVNGSGVLQQLYDPATTYNEPANCNGSGAPNPYCRAPFANNQIPIARLAPATKSLYAITPLPNLPVNPLVQTNLNAPNPTYFAIPTITFRLDHSFNENNKAYLRYTSNNQKNSALRNNPGNEPATIAGAGFPNAAVGLQSILISSFATSAGFTHVFSPTFFSETVVSQQWFMEYVGAGGNPGLDYESMLGLPNNFGQSGFPQLEPSLFYYYGTQWQYQENQIISNLDENLTKTVGRHQMQFGGRYRHERFFYLPDRNLDNATFGAFATAIENPGSGANYTAASNTGYSDADFFLGAATGYTQQKEPPTAHFHDMEFDAYFQDNYHVTKNLTVNIGLRYEAHPAPWMKYNLMEGFDLKNDAVVLDNPPASYISNGYTTQAILTNLQNLGVVFETPAQAGYPTAMIENANLNVSPRLGLAYQPFGGKYGTVLRGAYGRYIYPIPVRNSEMNAIKNVPFQATYTQSYTAANQSPDGQPNYLLRAPQSVIMGQNSTNVVSTAQTNSILPGSSLFNLNPDYKPDFVTQVNATIEQPLKGNAALRLTWLWSHGTNLDYYYGYNAHPSSYVYEMLTGQTPPTGGASVIGTAQQNTYAATATGPYDQSKWGASTWDNKHGFSNDNALQVNYQRLFHHGIAYQINYVWSKPFRLGGNYFRDGGITTATGNYVGIAQGTANTYMTPAYGQVIAPLLPPARPQGIASYADWHALDVYEQYRVDTAIPKQHIQFNGIVDLPFGRGKRFMGNANRLMDALVGGFQLAGDGSILSQDFGVSTSNWGPTNPIKYYKHGAPITDCRSGTCYKEYEWFNGYVAPTVNAAANCTTKCITGLPTNWAPYTAPIDNTPGTKYYGSNEVNITLPNGTTSAIGYSPGGTGVSPFNKTILNGPINYTIDLSVFKVIPITETVNLRFNMDAFNALNMMGFNNPNGTDGTEAYQPNGVSSSYNTPRQVQFTLRLTF